MHLSICLFSLSLSLSLYIYIYIYPSISLCLSLSVYLSLLFHHSFPFLFNTRIFLRNFRYWTIFIRITVASGLDVLNLKNLLLVAEHWQVKNTSKNVVNIFFVTFFFSTLHLCFNLYLTLFI